MTGALWYPPADRSQTFAPNATVTPTKQLWHTTEGPGGFPAYAGMTMAPNFTYDPWQHLWRQHCPINGTARALANGKDSAGNTIYQTNRKGVVQVEICCYCDLALAAQRGQAKFGVDRLDQQAYDDLAEFSAWLKVEWGIPQTSTVSWEPYPKSAGAGNGVRMSAAGFASYQGHLAHMHAPYNEHGDAGALDVTRILATAPAPTPAPLPEGDDMPKILITTDGANYLVTGQGATYIGNPAELAAIRRVLTETESGRVLLAEINLYKAALARIAAGK